MNFNNMVQSFYQLITKSKLIKINIYRNKKIYTIIIFMTIFVVLYKNLNVKGFRRFLIAFKLAVIITLTVTPFANAKHNGFLPRAEGFTFPISRAVPNNSGYFVSKTSSSSGSPKKSPNSYPSANSNVDAKPKLPHQINLQSQIPTF